MQTQEVDTMGRDGRADADARRPARTVRSAVSSSSPIAICLATFAGAIALASSASSGVPLASALTVALLIPPALVDLLDRRLPNRMLAVAALAGTVTAVATITLGGAVDVRGTVIGALACAGPLLVMHLLSPSAMGFGDVKAAAVLGAALGLIHPFFALLGLAAGSLVGAAVGLVGRRRSIAFGPALVAGAVASLALAASPVDLVDRALVDRDQPITPDSEVVTT